MSYRYFENRDCPYYPCHDAEHINCLFCFCPLYDKEDCGGVYHMTEDQSGCLHKDCSGCMYPHAAEGYDYVIEHLYTKEYDRDKERE